MSVKAPRYLRISITARCNLHCVYCRGADDGMEAVEVSEPSLEEIALLTRCAAAEGVRKVRITGGEPLMRDDLEQVVRRVDSTAGIAETTLTTNAIGLGRRAAGLRDAGLTRVNISLDTLQGERFRAIARHDRLAEVIAGIETAARTFDEVKLNTVLMRGVNDDEIEALVRFAGERDLRIRFIERYGAAGVGGAGAAGGEGVPAGEVKRRLRELFGDLEPVASSALSVEQAYVLPEAGGAAVGVISSAGHPPCAACSKLRFTCEGYLYECLFASVGTDLRALLGAGDERAIRKAIRETFARKDRRGPGKSPCVAVPVSLVGG